RTRKLSLKPILASAAVFGILGLSFYSTQQSRALTQLATGTSHIPELAQRQPEQDVGPADKDQLSGGISPSSSNSGATVERTLTDDGSVVTKYTPRLRDGDGPVLINAQRIGQDPRTASMPNEALLEDSPYGRLPIVGPDGLRPMDQYARPWSGARGTRIAIVVGGLGLSQTGTQRAIKDLPPAITLGFAVSGNS